MNYLNCVLVSLLLVIIVVIMIVNTNQFQTTTVSDGEMDIFEDFDPISMWLEHLEISILVVFPIIALCISALCYFFSAVDKEMLIGYVQID